ncbi:3-mercaptopyruvate sulfurtransferase-like [Physella acuta]|uniref:3-mercaptopyruvate sulfurtransferase-like n=1 Tax=Physella acuta TaxID=109671 RepID=UPI0027DACF72|nr:3-mercaptopyruvate sulfurtransferase-like [Physella acuta]XP_059145291.1 3-mercaptopyruvate sulfurtransferase-like [Physella acuta]XP_059145292.1 3-mercaptopyruvate sulfurtransferase-like [Physella acuta]
MLNASHIVSVKWLKDILSSSSKFRILDGSWHLPNTGRIAANEYKEKHIPGALFFDIDECADKSTNLPHMIPSPQEFGDYVGSLGINNDTQVIVYDNNPQFPIFSAQRVWWTFRLFGHKKVCILEGGLPKWLSDGGQTTNETVSVSKEKFVVHFNKHLVKSIEDIKRNIEKPEFTLVDARPDGRFKGEAPEPRPDTKPGCIVNSINIPFMNTMNLNERKMKTPEELKKLFQDSGIDLNKPLVASCGSGISACILALSAAMLGKEDVAVYDGSWTEWYHHAPAQLKLNVPK